MKRQPLKTSVSVAAKGCVAQLFVPLLLATPSLLGVAKVRAEDISHAEEVLHTKETSQPESPVGAAAVPRRRETSAAFLGVPRTAPLPSELPHITAFTLQCLDTEVASYLPLADRATKQESADAKPSLAVTAECRGILSADAGAVTVVCHHTLPRAKDAAVTGIAGVPLCRFLNTTSPMVATCPLTDKLRETERSDGLEVTIISEQGQEFRVPLRAARDPAPDTLADNR